VGLVLLIAALVVSTVLGQGQATDEARRAVAEVQAQTVPLAEASQAASDFAFAVGTRLFVPGESAGVNQAAARVEAQIDLLEQTDLGRAQAHADQAIAVWREFSPALIAADSGGGLDATVTPGMGNISRVADEFSEARTISVAAVQEHLARAEEDQRRSEETSTLLAAGMAVLVALGAAASTQSLLGPIRALRRAATTVATGNLDHRVPVDGPAELAELAEAFNTMASKLEDREAELVRRTLHDPLTGIGNRLLLQDRMAAAMTRRLRHPQTRVAIVMLDLDGFKAVNDTLGHEAGDQALRITAARIVPLLRDGDTLVRIGGDEFAVLLDSGIGDAVEVAERICAGIRPPMAIGPDQVTLTVSAGVSAAPGDANTDEELLRHADVAMYEAKRKGGDRAERYRAELTVPASGDRALTADLRRAVERDEIEVHYQPAVNLRTGAVVAVEALVRWRHPERGLLTPAHFLGLAEETGLINPIGWHVLRTAARDGLAWATDHDLVVAANTSAQQLQDPAFGAAVRATLEETGFPANRLVLEITETELVHEVGVVADRLVPLQALGVRIALDDFGTGYTSLQYLTALPIDIIKIDRAFVHGAADHPDQRVLLRTIVELAQRVDCKVVAEGIERHEDVAVLEELSIPVGQGFLFHRPMPADAVDRLLAAAPTPDQSTAPAGTAP
jgi:diguanylate cyclase (GGDEF)-like protein